MKRRNAKRKTQNPGGGRGWWGWAVLLLAVVVCVSLARGARGEDSSPLSQLLKDVGIDQRMGAQVPMDLQFRDEAGNLVRLRDLQRGNR